MWKMHTILVLVGTPCSQRAIVTVILKVLLLILGVGLGFSSRSPWGNEGISAKAIGISTLVWLGLTQLASSSVGGYMAGRLSVK